MAFAVKFALSIFVYISLVTLIGILHTRYPFFAGFASCALVVSLIMWLRKRSNPE
jgi:hypothetical protein